MFIKKQDVYYINFIFFLEILLFFVLIYQCLFIIFTYIIFSSSFSLFSVILDIVEERRKYSSSAVFTFLKSVLAHSLPSPGEKFTISTFSSSGANEPDKYELSVPPQNDFLLDYVNNIKQIQRNDFLISNLGFFWCFI